MGCKTQEISSSFPTILNTQKDHCVKPDTNIPKMKLFRFPLTTFISGKAEATKLFPIRKMSFAKLITKKDNSREILH